MKCHICGKLGPYTEMIDYTAYSVHPKCEQKEQSVSHNAKEFRECSVCCRENLSKEELGNHLIRDHTIGALVDLIVNGINKV